MIDLHSKRRISENKKEIRRRVISTGLRCSIFLIVIALDVLKNGLSMLSAFGIFFIIFCIGLAMMFSRRFKEAYLDEKYLYYLQNDRVIQIDRKHITDVELSIRKRTAILKVSFSKGALKETINLILANLDAKTRKERVIAWKALKEELSS